jgi:hypothetical protein
MGWFRTLGYPDQRLVAPTWLLDRALARAEDIALVISQVHPTQLFGKAFCTDRKRIGLAPFS